MLKGTKLYSKLILNSFKRNINLLFCVGPN